MTKADEREKYHKRCTHAVEITIHMTRAHLALQSTKIAGTTYPTYVELK